MTHGGEYERVVIVVPGRWTIIIESITELTLQYVIFAARRLFLYMSSFVITCHIRREYAVMHYIPFPCFVWRIASVRDSSVTWHVMMWWVIRLDFRFEDLVDRWLVGLWSNFWHIIVGVWCWILPTNVQIIGTCTLTVFNFLYIVM